MAEYDLCVCACVRAAARSIERRNSIEPIETGDRTRREASTSSWRPRHIARARSPRALIAPRRTICHSIGLGISLSRIIIYTYGDRGTSRELGHVDDGSENDDEKRHLLGARASPSSRARSCAQWPHARA